MDKTSNRTGSEPKNYTLDFLNKLNKPKTQEKDDPITTQQNVFPKISEDLHMPIEENNLHIPIKTITCDRCMARLEYSGENVFVICISCGKRLNPLKITKFSCFYCGKNSYIKDGWDRFRCSVCNKIIFRVDLEPQRKQQLIKNYLETECPQIRKRSDSGFKIPANPYMIFSKLKRVEVKKLQPELNFSEIGTVLGKMWNNLTDAEKQVYKDMYEENKKENNKN